MPTVTPVIVSTQHWTFSFRIPGFGASASSRSTTLPPRCIGHAGRRTTGQASGGPAARYLMADTLTPDSSTSPAQSPYHAYGAARGFPSEPGAPEPLSRRRRPHAFAVGATRGRRWVRSRSDSRFAKGVELCSGATSSRAVSWSWEHSGSPCREAQARHLPRPVRAARDNRVARRVVAEEVPAEVAARALLTPERRHDPAIPSEREHGCAPANGDNSERTAP